MKNKNTDLFVESLHKLKNKISQTVVTLRLDRDTHVPDLMTRIRILPSVAVVGQKEKVDRFMEGDARLTVSIKFLPISLQVYTALKELCTMIKRLPGVMSITVVSFDKRKITLKGEKIIF
tara:strand:+ start:688 stop:1047 length:360 start_codon:yes stop_codon:yes gene_type:complete